MTRKVILFTDSIGFGYDAISSLHDEGLLDEVYVQSSPMQNRYRRYVIDTLRLRRINRRIVGLVDRINRPSRRMTIAANDGILSEVRAVNFSSYQELRDRVTTNNEIIVVYGTGLAPSWVYKDAFQSTNVHWRLSPYYRGILCTDWAILNRDLNNIGFTLHELSRKVDGGQIITQGRVEPKAGDSIGSITLRLHNMAKSALLKAVAAAMEGNLPSITQDLSKGRNYTSKDWNVITSIRLKKLLPIDQRAIDESGPELPIHENAMFSTVPR